MQECQLFDCEFQCILLLAILGQKLRVCAGLHRHDVFTKRDQAFFFFQRIVEYKKLGMGEGVEVQTDRQNLPYIHPFHAYLVTQSNNFCINKGIILQPTN